MSIFDEYLCTQTLDMDEFVLLFDKKGVDIQFFAWYSIQALRGRRAWSLKTIQEEQEEKTVDSEMSFGLAVERQQETIKDETKEFDPGSGRTLAACLTHASRAGTWKQQCDHVLAADG